MFREIRRIRSSTPEPTQPDQEGLDFSGGAGEGATRDIESAVESGDTEPTPTERERDSLNPEYVESGVESDLIADGIEEDLARSIASWVSTQNVDYVINPGRVSGSSLFDVRNDHGTIRIVLNQEHRLYRLLRVLSDSHEIEDDLEDELEETDTPRRHDGFVSAVLRLGQDV